MKQIKFELMQGEFWLSRSENGSDWTLVYKDKEIENVEVIEKAFIRIGYQREQKRKCKCGNEIELEGEFLCDYCYSKTKTKLPSTGVKG